MAQSPPEPHLDVSINRPFDKAVNLQNTNMVQNFGVDPNSTDFDGDSALHYAVRTENIIAIVKFFLDHGACLNCTNSGGHSALHLRQENSYLANANAGDPIITNSLGNSILHYAAATENIDILKMLLDIGADPNLKNSRGNSPLHEAVIMQDIDSVRILLARGANPNLKNKLGYSALHVASQLDINLQKLCYSGDVRRSIIKALLKAGADAAITDNNGSTALHLATCKDIVLCLLEGGAPIDAQDNNGRTPLHLQSHRKTADFGDILETFIFAGASLDIPDVQGETFIDILCREDILHYIIGFLAKCKMLNIKKNLTRTFEDPGTYHYTRLYMCVEALGSWYILVFDQIIFYTQLFKEELDRVKDTVVEGVCLYDVLKYSLKDLRFLYNAKFRNFIEEYGFELNFFRFYQLIRISVWEAEILKDLMDELSVDLTIKLKSESVPSIPPEVWRLIITELDYQDVKNLKTALQF